MEVRVLGISGSPHRHGNTETLLDAFLEGTKDAGAAFEKVVISRLDYAPCRGCNACHRTGKCILDDDFIPLFDRVLEVDALALASPIYTMGITAELKALIDRAQFLWAQKFILKTRYYSHGHMERHKGVFISTAGQPWENVFDTAFPMVTSFFNIVGFEYYDNVVVQDLDACGGIRGHPTALDDARAKGGEVVREIARLRESG